MADSQQQQQTMDMEAMLDEALDELDDDESEDENDRKDEWATLKTRQDEDHRRGDQEKVDPPNGNQKKNSEATVNDDVQTTKAQNVDINDEQSSSNDVPNQKNDDDDDENNKLSSNEMFQNMLREFIEAEDDGTDPDERLGQFMDTVQNQISTSTSKNSTTTTWPNDNTKNNTKSSTSANKKNKKKSMNETSTLSNNNNKDHINMSEVDKTIAAILDEMAKASININADGSIPSSSSSSGDNGERIDVENLFKGLFNNNDQQQGQDFNLDSLDPDSVIDGMMEQLLSKDLMYEPMKQVTEKFPKWLNENKSILSEEEYTE